MGSLRARPFGLPHAVFLTRADGPELDSHACRGQAAFLILRLVDLLGRYTDADAQGFVYQRAATARFCEELNEPGHPETALLRAILDSTTVTTSRVLLLDALRAYGEYLDDMGRPEEVSDARSTLVLVGRGSRDQRAALNVRLARCQLRVTAGHTSSAEGACRRVAADARRAGQAGLQLSALVTLSRTLRTSGRPAEAARDLWRGIKQDDPALTARVLLELADALREAGALVPAALAANSARSRASDRPSHDRAARTLLTISAEQGDEVGFARWWREVSPEVDPGEGSHLREVLRTASVTHSRAPASLDPSLGAIAQWLETLAGQC